MPEQGRGRFTVGPRPIAQLFMRARLIKQSDLADVAGLMKGADIDFTQSIVFVVENDVGRVVGALISRRVFYVHGLRVDAGAHNRLAAEVLLNYALAIGQTAIANPNARPEAAFVVEKDNVVMRRFIEAYGAKPDDDHEGQIYTLELA